MDSNGCDKSYKEGQFSQWNLDGKTVYHRELLMALRNVPASRVRPDNIPDVVLADDSGSDVNANTKTVDSNGCDKSLYKEGQFSPWNLDGKMVYHMELLMALRDVPASRVRPDNIPDVVVADDRGNDMNAKAKTVDSNCCDKSLYKEGQFSPWNLDGKTVYHMELLMALRDVPASRVKPDNIPDVVVADDRGNDMNANAKTVDSNGCDKSLYKEGQFSPWNLDGKMVYHMELLMALRDLPASRVKPDNIPDVVVADDRGNDMNANAKTVDSNVCDKSLYKEGQFSPWNLDGKTVYHRELLMALRDVPASRVRPDNIPDIVLADDRWSYVNANAKTVDSNGCDKSLYKEGQFSPWNLDGKMVYHMELLMALRDVPASRVKPDNIPDVVVADDRGRVSDGRASMGGRTDFMNSPFTNYWGKWSSHGSAPILVREDVKLHESENAWRPAWLNKGDSFVTEDDKKTEELYKKVRGVLNKLMPQKLDKLLSQIKALNIDTVERLQDVVDLVFEKAVDELIFSAVYALMCKELELMQVTTAQSTPEKPDFVNFRELLITRCHVEVACFSVDESIRNDKVKEIEECNDPERKKDLQFELEEFDRRLRMKSVGNGRFIGELFKKGMLTVNDMMRCLSNLLNHKDEESLECLCMLLTTVAKELESNSGVNLSQIFGAMKAIVDKRDGNVSSRIRFILQDVIDLRNSKWVPRLNIQLLSLVPLRPRKNKGMGPWEDDREGRYLFSDDYCERIANTNRSRTPFPVQSVKFKSKGCYIQPLIDEPLGSSQLFGNWGKGLIGSTIKTEKPMSPEHMERGINNALDKYVTGSCSVDFYFDEVSTAVPTAYFSRMIEDSYLHVLEKSQQARSKTGGLFAQLVKDGRIQIEDYSDGLEAILSKADDLKIGIPKIWDYLAEMIVDLICEGVLPLSRLYKACHILISQGQAANLLAPLFKLVVKEKGPNFLHGMWLSSGLRLSDFMPDSQVDAFVKDNQFEFLVGGHGPARQNQTFYEQIQAKLLELLQAKTSFDDTVNWITANVGDRVTECQFIKALATAIFIDSISSEIAADELLVLKLVPETLSAHNNLLLKYVDNNATYELQCLYALQALIHKLGHPQGLHLSIWDKLYELGTFSEESFIAWENSSDPAEQEGKGVALKQLTCFFTELKEKDEEEYVSSTSDEA